ncbi:MAG: hypothetical protein WCI12_07045 [Actinomycetes bacterium]
MTPSSRDLDAIDVTRRIARSIQTTIGWIFWDPGAVARFEELGLPGPLGYIASRCAPLAGAGPEAVSAAFGSISQLGIALAFDVLTTPDRFMDFWRARDAAVLEGLRSFAPEIEGPLVQTGPDLWGVVDQLPRVGRVFFGSLLAVPRPTDPLLSAWHAVNALREWRGDTHWALVVASGLTHAEASILHNAWLGYEPDWLARSRGTSDEDLTTGWHSLAERGLVVDGVVTPEGIALRQELEDETDRLTALPWELFGLRATESLAGQLEPPCEALLARVDETAGPNYQPASRIRAPRT